MLKLCWRLVIRGFCWICGEGLRLFLIICLLLFLLMFLSEFGIMKDFFGIRNFCFLMFLSFLIILFLLFSKLLDLRSLI